MSEYHSVALDSSGYEFTASEKGAIHLFAVTDTADLRTVLMEESYPATAVLSDLEIEDFYVESSLDGGKIGLHIAQLDRFLDGAHKSPYSVTVEEDVRSYIEEQS